MPQQKTSTAVLYIVLLLSHHAPSCSAFRSQTATSKDDTVEAALTQATSEDVESMGSRSLADLMHGEAAEAGMAVSMDDAGWYCGWSYATTMRWYHFEMDFQEKDGHTRHFAAEFVRSPKAPRILLHAGQTWSVRATGDPALPADWVLTPFPSATGAAYSVEIDIMYDVEYIRSYALRDGGPRGLQIMFKNGTDFRMVGGMYYPEEVLAASLWSNEGTDAPEAPPESASTVAADSSVVVHGIRMGAGVLGDALAHHGGKWGTKGLIGATTIGFGLSYGFSSAVALMNSILTYALGQMGALTGMTLSAGLPVLTATQIFTFTSYAGTLGLAGGAAIGLSIGLIVGVPISAATAVHQWIKQTKEFHISASEKIFAKLYCHNAFKACDSAGYILVPLNKDCPDVTTLSDITD